MLQRLFIRNYAIIDELEIGFEKGLNIITGETGAGKSILMGALGLVLGNRADTSVLFEAGEKCIVEATFDGRGNAPLAEVLRKLELDEEETIVLRREIAASGKSRSFINDTPVTLQDLREVADWLVDLHRQFDTQVLGQDRFQTEVLDALAAQLDLMKTYGQEFRIWREAQTTLKRWKEEQEAAAREMDYHRFLFQELEALDLQPNELEQLEAESELLSNADQVKNALAQVAFALDENEPSLVQQVKQLAGVLSHAGATLPEMTEQNDRLLSVYIELQDIARELSRLHDKVALDPERLALVNERLSEGYRLMKKHQVQSTQELLDIREKLSRQIYDFSDRSEKLVQQEILVQAALKKVMETGAKLSHGRAKIIPAFEETTQQYLSQMEMANARLKVVCEKPVDEEGRLVPGLLGIDKVSIGFDANKTGRFEPLEKVASGGERSRLMLAIKAQVAKSIQLPALIFDEIDTGISGEAARQVGLLLRQLAIGHQVISITHQPQIAAKAHQHFYVYKQVNQGQINTRMRKLLPQERVDAIARMLSGEAITESALQIAREMVEQPAMNS
jgi:DNA repair protein RecN (Recombination protein N)